MKNYFVFDVESIGLTGEAFAVGGVLITEDGSEFDSFYFGCNPDLAQGERSDREWIRENCALKSFNCASPHEVRQRFFLFWDRIRSQGLTMAADCPWPVEAKFLLDCQRQHPDFPAPYPLIDVASVVLASGKDPIGDFGRHEDELPKHNPLQDARQSARVLIESLKSIELSQFTE